MAIAMTLLAKEKCGPKIHKQLLYYPVTNACFQTESYHRLQEDIICIAQEWNGFGINIYPCSNSAVIF